MKRLLLPGLFVVLSLSYAAAEPSPVHWVCHRTNGDGNPWRLISVSENALDTHLGHGDLHAGDSGVLTEPIFGWNCELAP